MHLQLTRLLRKTECGSKAVEETESVGFLPASCLSRRPGRALHPGMTTKMKPLYTRKIQIKSKSSCSVQVWIKKRLAESSQQIRVKKEKDFLYT